jgi:hypothetical protein
MHLGPSKAKIKCGEYQEMSYLVEIASLRPLQVTNHWRCEDEQACPKKTKNNPITEKSHKLLSKPCLKHETQVQPQAEVLKRLEQK